MEIAPVDRQSVPMQVEASPPIMQGLQPIPTEPPAWAEAAGRVIQYLMNDFGGGQRRLKLAWAINFQTLATIPLFAIFIFKYHNVSAAAWIYAAMQSSYGLVWIIKDLAFPDSSFQKSATIGAAIASLITVLCWYWVFGWLLISRIATPKYPLPDYAWFSLCISLCIVGCAIMIASDAQKYFTLRLKRGLITDGMFRFIRHPNYLGEMMIYSSFALMVWHWLPFVVLAWVWGGREHDSQGNQHVAVPRVGTVQETFVVVVATAGLDTVFLKFFRMRYCKSETSTVRGFVSWRCSDR